MLRATLKQAECLGYLPSWTTTADLGTLRADQPAAQNQDAEQ
jgi:hypothetical protein